MEKLPKQLQSKQDLIALTTLAQDREIWRQITKEIITSELQTLED